MGYPYAGKGPVLAYTTNQHLLVDIDDVTFGHAKRVAEYIQREFKVGNCLIVRSSVEYIERHKNPIYRNVLAIIGCFVWWFSHDKGGDIVDDAWDFTEIGGYHLIFNNTMPWEQIVMAIMVLAMKGIVEWRFFTLRQTKMDVTVRYSSKWYRKKDTVGFTPAPVPVALLKHKSDLGDDNILTYVNQAGLEDVFADFNC